MSLPEPRLELSPEFCFDQPILGTPGTFEAAKVLTDLILSDSFELIEQQHTYGDIPFDPDVVPLGIEEAIPGTTFDRFTLTRMPATRYAASQIMLHLRVKDDPERNIHIAELPNRGKIPGDFSITDTDAVKGFRTASGVERKAVQRFLEQQLWSPDLPPFPQRMNIQELAQHLGARARAFRRERRVGATQLPGFPIFHAERSVLFNPYDISNTPMISAYSTWLTGSIDVDNVSIEDLRIRTKADFNGNNLRDPKNKMSFIVTAQEMNDEAADKLGKRYKLTTQKAKQIVRSFTEYVEDCTQQLRGEETK